MYGFRFASEKQIKIISVENKQGKTTWVHCDVENILCAHHKNPVERL